jgi:hypothetical protein
MLVHKADALVVLPGGPGTWDELWEMACARGIGLTNLPIVCVNCNGFYEPFREMLVRAYSDKLTKLEPHELVHFEPTAEAAVRWVETICGGRSTSVPSAKSRSTPARETSFFHAPIVSESDSRVVRSLSNVATRVIGWLTDQTRWMRMGWAFAAGVTIGAVVTSQVTKEHRHR